jgi:hypothetical protein
LTPEAAWKSLEKASNADLNPGDSLLFIRGGSWTGTLYITRSGTRQSAIYVGDYGSDDAPKPLIIAGGEDAVRLTDVKHVTVENLELTNFGAKSIRRGIFAEFTTNTNDSLGWVTIKGLDIHDIDGYSEWGGPKWSCAAIFVGNSHSHSTEIYTAPYVTDILIEDCVIYDIATIGIAVFTTYWADTNHMINNVTIRGNVMRGTGADAIILGASKNSMIEHNAVFDVGINGESLEYIAAMFQVQAKNITFQYNEAARCVPTGDSQGYDCDWGLAGTHIYQYNYSHENAGGFFMLMQTCCDYNDLIGDFKECIVRYNISQNERGATSVKKIGYARIYNNTIYDPENIALGGTAVYTNNIFHAPSVTIADGNEFVTNCFLPDADAPDGNLSADPQLEAPGTGEEGRKTCTGYRLTEQSACRNAGTPIQDFLGTDYFGVEVPPNGNPDIGACQYSEKLDAKNSFCRALADMAIRTEFQKSLLLSGTLFNRQTSHCLTALGRKTTFSGSVSSGVYLGKTVVQK